jgi:hypothetical protein
MKLALSLLIAAPLVFASFGASAQYGKNKSDNDHYKSQQRANESNRQTNNSIVNNNSQRNYSNKR